MRTIALEEHYATPALLAGVEQLQARAHRPRLWLQGCPAQRPHHCPACYRAWGWHIETALHVLRLVSSGAFDRYPQLQLIIGHLGETLPFVLPRLDIGLPNQITRLARPVSAYLRENVHYTFSGFNWTPAFLDLFLQVGVDRIMFSTDYPYGSMEQARTFLDALPVSPADREPIAHANAEQLLHL